MRQGRRRIGQTPATGRSLATSRHGQALPLLLRVQRAGGNRAAAALVQREAGGAPPPPVDPGPSIAKFDAENPGIIAAMSYEQLNGWHDLIEVWTNNSKVDDALARHEKREREAMGNPDSRDPIISDRYLEEAERIGSRRKRADPGKSRVTLSPSNILAQEVGAAQPWNVDAEQRYRTWAVATFSAQSVEAELTDKREIVSALEESEHPGLASGIPHVNLLWGGYRIKHTKGIVTWNDLMDMKMFRDKYDDEVTHSPAVKALNTGLDEVEYHIKTMKIEHQSRSDENAEHGVVRHISEAIGAPSQIELMKLRLVAIQNPNDLDAKAALAEKEAEAGNYPKLKDNEAGVGIWHEADMQLAAALRFREEGKFELAVAALTECEHSTALATAKFAGYERRVMGGAGTAVKWLERAKTAGKIASAFTGTGGVVRAAFMSAGYSFAQEGSEQVAAHWIDPTNKIDLKGLTEQAAIEGLASLFGGVTQGAFVEALTARFGAKLVTEYGLSQGAAKVVLSAVGATTSTFYNVPAKMALDRIISGKAFPNSLSDVCNLVTEESLKAGALDVAGAYVHAHGTKADPPKDPAAAPAGTTIEAPQAVVEALAGEGVAPAGPEGTRSTGEMPAPMAAGVRGAEPKTIAAESLRIAEGLQPLRAKWPGMSPKARAEALVDAVHATLAETGVPKPEGVTADVGGGQFRKESWTVELNEALLSKEHLTVDEFAWACEMTRHELEHAMQFFRIARREHTRTGEDATALSNRLHIPIERVTDAIDSQTGKRPAEDMPAGGDLDTTTAAIYENMYEPAKRARRHEILAKLDAATAGAKAAREKYDARIKAESDPELQRKADEEYRAEDAPHRKVIEEYQNFPEEVPAFKAGGEMNAAVKAAAQLHEAKLQARVSGARVELERASAAVERAEQAASAATKPGERLPTTVRAAVKRARSQFETALDHAREAEKELAAALDGGSK